METMYASKRKLFILEEEEDKELAGTKQESANKISLDQETETCIHTEKTLKSGKKIGTKSQGAMYIIKITALLFLKLINLGCSFFLESNLVSAGEFGDIAVKYTKDDGTKATIFIKVQHDQNDNKRRSLSFVMEYPYFDLHEYFISACNSHILKYPGNLLCSNPCNMLYLIITNVDVDQSILSNVTEVSSFVHEITCKGDVLKVNDFDEYNNFCYIVERVNKTERKDYDPQLESDINEFVMKTGSRKLKNIVKTLCEKSNETLKDREKYKNISVSNLNHFVSKTIICCNYMKDNEIESEIKTEISKALSISSQETETVFNTFISQLISWSDYTYYLTDKSELWYDIVEATETARFKNREEELLAYNVDGNGSTFLKIPYEKTPGCTSMQSMMYEVKMIALIFLKVLNLGYSFYLGSNLDGAGDFDNIVVKYIKDDKTTNTLFIQLKYAEKDDTYWSLSLVEDESVFDLHKYFMSVCESHIFKDPKHVMFNSDPSNVKYLIFTNADVDRTILKNDDEVSSFSHGILNHGDILKIKDYEKYKEFCSLIEKLNNYEKEYDRPLETEIDDDKFRDFISNTRICCKQMNDKELDTAIKKEIEEALKISNDETEQVFARLFYQLIVWLENESYYLTENWKLWNNIKNEIRLGTEKEKENCLA